MNYVLSYQNANRQYLDIEFEVNCQEENQIQVQLPAWRPGRYELGNFAKNIQQWMAYNERGEALNFVKQSKDCWLVDCQNANRLIVKYNYYAADLNAGSTYLDASQLYVNPVNCLLYLPNRPDEACELSLDIPADYLVAIGLPEIGKNKYKAANFDELADSPFIASNSLQKLSYDVDSYRFHLWFQGEIKLNYEKLISDFKAFTKAQINLFGDFPCPEYHFFFQILPHSAYHGVEHSNSTVITLGPSYAVFKKSGRYEDLLGVSCHELFHTWNIKRIRPVEMWPYDLSQENYSRLGYLAEGATTWYGDELLKRSEVFDDAAYFKTLEQLLDRHFNNPGVENLSVADASYDTWLDGYVPGVPNRKSSIYVEGALVTMMLDVIIKKNSKNKHSFDDVMRSFYNDFYKAGKGVSEDDYRNVVEKYADKDLSLFFDKYVNGAENMEADLIESFGYLGLSFTLEAAEAFHEAHLGFRYLDEKVYSIFPGSPAELAGLTVGDSILAINGYKVNNDLADWCRYFEEDQLVLSCHDKHGNSKEIVLKAAKANFYIKSRLSRNSI